MSWKRSVLLLCLLAAPRLGSAFTLEPISQVLTPTGTRARCSYEVTNTGSEAIAIEFFVAHLVKNLDGSEDLSRREDEDFLVFPPQIVVPPGATRTIRVRWLGEPQPERELSFRFMADQIPVDLAGPTNAENGEVRATVKFIYQFHGTLFVRPRGAKPNVDVEDVELLRGTDGSALRVRLQNTGTMRGWVRRFVLRLVIAEEIYELTESDLPALENLPVLAGGHREVIVPWPDTLPMQQPTSATLRVVYRSTQSH